MRHVTQVGGETLGKTFFIMFIIYYNEEALEMNVPIYWFRPKKWFDVRIKELVSKVQNSGPFLRKKRSSF